MRLGLLGSVLFYFSFAIAQVPSYGSSKTIDIATWNLFWYGHPNYGSTNNATQRNGVGEVLRNTRVDIWFFQEIVDSSDLSQVLKESGNFGHIYSHYWQDQKMGIAWDTKQWVLLSDSQLYASNSTSFANGRLPLFAALVSINTQDTLFLVNLHLKAHTGTAEKKEEAYWNRRASAVLMNAWQQAHAGSKVLIAGDWNDDIDISNHKDTVSPFFDVMDLDGKFLFEKEAFAGEHSWYYGNSMIDHMWANPRMLASFKLNSQKILPLDWYLPNYPTQVSDHFPLFAAFEPSKSTGLSDVPHEILLYPNPCSGTALISGISATDIVKLVDAQGIQLNANAESLDGHVKISGLKAGYYFIQVSRGEQVFYYRLVVKP